eukprot:3175661-Ditylum_brightwellii.AAC.1
MKANSNIQKQNKRDVRIAYKMLSAVKNLTHGIPSLVYPDGIHVEELVGLSSGAAIDPNNPSVGYVVFVPRGKNSSDENESEDPQDVDDDFDDDDSPSLDS